MEYEEIIRELEKLSNSEIRVGMGRFGIETKKALGISVTTSGSWRRILEIITILLKNFGVLKYTKQESWLQW